MTSFRKHVGPNIRKHLRSREAISGRTGGRLQRHLAGQGLHTGSNVWHGGRVLHIAGAAANDRSV